jgi:hypothetical protein
MDSLHVSIERSVAFLLDGVKLTPREHEHLAKCEECRLAMVNNTTKELDKRSGK